MHVAVIGATGNAGRLIARFLLEDPSIEVNACARSAPRLRALHSSLGSTAGTLRSTVVDVTRRSDMLEVVSQADLVVGATSRAAHAPDLAALAVEAGTSYLGVYLSEPAKWRRLRNLHQPCVERGVMVVDDGGWHPGVPAAMVRAAAEQGALSEAWVGAKFGVRWDELDVVGDTIDDFLTEMETTDPSVWVDEGWIRGFRHSHRFEFGLGGDPVSCIPMCLEETRELAASGTLNSTGFFMAGFGPAVDYGVLPLSVGLAKIKRAWGAGLLWWGLRRFASSSDFGVLVLDGRRRASGEAVRMRVLHSDPYVLTAAPAVATIRQMMSQPRPGVWTQAAFVDPTRFFDQLGEMGVQVEM